MRLLLAGLNVFLARLNALLARLNVLLARFNFLYAEGVFEIICELNDENLVVERRQVMGNMKGLQIH